MKNNSLNKPASMFLGGLLACFMLSSNVTLATAAPTNNTPLAQAVTPSPTTAVSTELTIFAAIPADTPNTVNPWTDAKVAEITASADSYWSVMSENKAGFKVATPQMKVVKTAATSTTPALEFAAIVAKEQGYDLTVANKAIVVLAPEGRTTLASGKVVSAAAASNGKKGGRVFMSGSVLTRTTLNLLYAHELGHLLGNAHANRLSCLNGVIDSTPKTDKTGWNNGNCKTVEYDDNNDIMSNGYAYGALNTYMAEARGFVKPTDIKNVTPITQTTDYTLTPWGDRTSTAVKSLKITDPYAHTPYYIELRQPVGLDAQDASGARTGIKILKSDIDGRGNVTLDPYSASHDLNTDSVQTWEAGDIFINAQKSFAVKIKSIDKGSAIVSVTRITSANEASYLAANTKATAKVTATMSANNVNFASPTPVTMTVKVTDAAGKPQMTNRIAILENRNIVGYVDINTSGIGTFVLPRETTTKTHIYTILPSDNRVHSSRVSYTVIPSITKASLTVSPTISATATTTLSAKNTLNTVTAKVTTPSNYYPQGLVTIKRNGVVIGSTTLTKEMQGTFAVKVGALPVGTHNFEVVYSGRTDALGAYGATATLSVKAV
jgi:hypothetical protein